MTPGRFIIKIYRPGGGLLTPFTGASDAGGYFFLPAIPAGEPYRAVAVDTVTGATRTFEGVSSTTGRQAYMFFDFSDATDTGVALSFGDTVSNGVPQAGAGNLENPGAFDVYTFEAEADREIILDVLSQAPTISSTRWTLTGPGGVEVFDRRFGDSGEVALRGAGTYTLTVSDANNDEAGIYSFRLIGLPLPGRFNIAIGDTVANGVPAAGAGNIETPGVVDRYSFTAMAGQRIYFDASSNSVGRFELYWSLLDPNGNRIGDISSFGSAGPITLAIAGSYTLLLDADTDRTPTYSFRLRAE